MFPKKFAWSPTPLNSYNRKIYILYVYLVQTPIRYVQLPNNFKLNLNMMHILSYEYQVVVYRYIVAGIF